MRKFFINLFAAAFLGGQLLFLYCSIFPNWTVWRGDQASKHSLWSMLWEIIFNQPGASADFTDLRVSFFIFCFGAAWAGLAYTLAMFEYSRCRRQ